MKRGLSDSWGTLSEDINQMSPLKEYLNQRKVIIVYTPKIEAIKMSEKSLKEASAS